MAYDKRILNEVLWEAGNPGHPAARGAIRHAASLGLFGQGGVAESSQYPDDAEALSERVRAALLLNSSGAPESCARADGLAYAINDDWRGVVIRGTSVSLSAVTESFARRDAVPRSLAEQWPELSLEDFRAAMLVISALLRGFEGPFENEGGPHREG